MSPNSLPELVKAYQLQETESGVRGFLTEVPSAELGEGDVVVKITHSSVNYKDGLAATGRAPIARSLPMIGGCDCSGVVVDAGESDFEEGQPVAVLGGFLSERHNGGYAQYGRFPAKWVHALPEGIDPWMASAIGTAGFTAALAIYKLEEHGVHPEDGKVVVTGASGGAGSLAVAMLAARGYEVVAVSGKEDCHEWLRSLGASEVLPRPDVTSKRPLESGLWAAAIDNVGGDTLAWLTRTMVPGGTIAAYGNAGGNQLSTTVLPFILRGINLLGVTITEQSFDRTEPVWRDIVAPALTREVLEKIASTISMEELAAAHERIVTEGIAGRAVVEI